jgi:hypothetical protein
MEKSTNSLHPPVTFSFLFQSVFLAHCSQTCSMYVLLLEWNMELHAYIEQLQYIRFEVFTAVTMKNAIFCDVAPCRSCVNRRFGGTYHLLHGRKIREPGTSMSRWLFLRNVGSYKIYTAPHPRKRHSSATIIVSFIFKVLNYDCWR